MTDSVSTYRALDMLTRTYAPKVTGRVPYWRPVPPPVTSLVVVPTWYWERKPAITEDPLCVLDANGSYLSAATSVEVAHGQLARLLRAVDLPARANLLDLACRTGYPTVQLLQHLTDEGYWPGVDVRDSWTSRTRCRLRGWSGAIAHDREKALAQGDTELYDRIKLGYSQAVTMMGAEGKSLLHRPDWSMAIRAQAAASCWRAAWAADLAGHSPVAMRRVDELVFPRYAVASWWSSGGTTPVRVDTTGRRLGTFKVKGVLSRGQWLHPESDTTSRGVPLDTPR